MPAFKLTMTFRPAVTPGGGADVDSAGSLQGWSESYYAPNNSSAANALAQAQNLFVTRRGILEQAWRIEKMRVFPFPSTRAASYKSYSIGDGRGRFAGSGPAGSTAEQPGDALICNLSSTSGRQRALLLRGLPRGVISAGNVFLAGPGFTPALNLFFAELTGNAPGFGIKVRTIVNTGTVSGIALATTGAALGSPATPVILSKLTEPQVLAGVKVRVSGTIGLFRMNGPWTIGDYNAVTIGGAQYNAMTCAAKRNVSVLGIWIQGGTYSSYTESLEYIQTAAVGYGTTRRTGSPSNRPRGRRSNRRS